MQRLHASSRLTSQTFRITSKMENSVCGFHTKLPNAPKNRNLLLEGDGEQRRCVALAYEKGLARILEVVDRGASPPLLKDCVVPRNTTFFPQVNNTTRRAAAPSRLIFCSFSKLLQSIQLIFPISKLKMPFATAATEKRRADLAAAFPQVGRCLKCFKHLIVDPESKCTVEAGKKNCTRCSGGGAICEKVSPFKDLSRILLEFPFPKNFQKFSKNFQADAEMSDSTRPFGSLQGLRRQY